MKKIEKLVQSEQLQNFSDDQLNEQLAWEQQMMDMGIARFRAQQDSHKEKGRFTKTSAGSKILKSYLSVVSEFISHYLAGNNPGARRRSKYHKYLQGVDADKLAMFALTQLIGVAYESREVAQVVRLVGSMVEDEIRFTKLELEYPELFNHISSEADKKKSVSYTYRKRILVRAMNDHGVEWKKWDFDTVYGVGGLVLSLALDASDIIQRRVVWINGKRKAVFKASEELDSWIKNSDEAVSVLLPDKMPCLIPPVDWTDYQTGGYYSHRLRMRTPLVKTRYGFEGKQHRRILVEANMPAVLTAVNKMQRTAWCINERVLETMQEVWNKNLQIGMQATEPFKITKSPLHDVKKEDMDEEQLALLKIWKNEARVLYTLEKKRFGNVLSVARTMRIGQMLRRCPKFYYVYQTDFRGRVYATTSGVSPQGSDQSKAILTFADKKPIGERGIWWLKIHGANKYGEDRCSNEERVRWIDDRKDMWLAVSRDPITYCDYWRDADKPYQFLAFCFEYAGAMREGTSFMSSLPIAVDGSCNGLQHFSALLRDEVGGKAVNLLPSDRPEDIYQEVADVCWNKLQKNASRKDQAGILEKNWIHALNAAGFESIPRKMTKKPVMTIPYGSTRQACTSSIFEWCLDNNVDKFPDNSQFKHCVALSDLLWASIEEVVLSAREAMRWIQYVSKEISALGKPLIYKSYLGFPVYQGACKSFITRVRPRVGGSQMEISVARSSEDIDPIKQRQGSSPNLIHHVDATHMMMCVNAGYSDGITSFAMIHDDFGVHASCMDNWQQIIRSMFVELHTECNALEYMKQQIEEMYGIKLKDIPSKGELEIKETKNSTYFFS